MSSASKPPRRWRLPSLGCLLIVAILVAGTFLASHQPIVTGASIFLVLIALWFYYFLAREHDGS